MSKNLKYDAASGFYEAEEPALTKLGCPLME